MPRCPRCYERLPDHDGFCDATICPDCGRTISPLDAEDRDGRCRECYREPSDEDEDSESLPPSRPVEAFCAPGGIAARVPLSGGRYGALGRSGPVARFYIETIEETSP